MANYVKGRDWATVCYPESVPSYWLDILEETHLQIAISPLHDNDVEPDGSVKKPHWHLLIRYEGPTTRNKVKELCDSINAVNPIKIDSARGMYRYHLHLDNPEKYQYDDRNRILLGGFDTTNLDALTETEYDKLENELLTYIEERDFTEYWQLVHFLKSQDFVNLLKVAKKRTIMLNAYLKSRKYFFKEILSENEKNS